jgi:hypothetical protein
MRVESNIVSLFEVSVQTWPKMIVRTTSMPLHHTTQSHDAEGGRGWAISLLVVVRVDRDSLALVNLSVPS